MHAVPADTSTMQDLQHSSEQQASADANDDQARCRPPSEQQTAPQAITADPAKPTVKDPICGMTVDPEKARTGGLFAAVQGKTYYFCSEECKEEFHRQGPQPGASAGADPGPEASSGHGRQVMDTKHAEPADTSTMQDHSTLLKNRRQPMPPAMASTTMINRIIDFSVEHRFVVFLLVAAACIAGWWSMQRLALDAIPDLSDTQVIVYSRWDRSPDIIEDQVTYPIVSAMLGAPKVKAVRGFSDFGYSYVYVIFEEGTDIYWARSRTLEYLSGVLPGLPQGVKTELGPDATGLGWIFQYALVDKSGKHSLAELRSYQDWYLRYYLKAVPGVAEVAPIGGFSKQYQVNVDPNRLQAYGLSISDVVDAVRGGNNEAGGRLIEFGGTEYMVRGRGYAKSLADFENILLTTSESGSPIRIKDIGQVALGPDQRRGVADLDGTGEVVSGIVVMRQGQNALDVIKRVKEKLEEIAPGLPEGVTVVPVYDRSELILRAIANLKTTLIEVIATVSLVILLFLWHIPSALMPMITIPVAVLLSFIPFQWMGVTANIMSLGGIAIAIGAMVDAAIVVVEQTHKKLEEWQRDGRKEDYRDGGRPGRETGGRAEFFFAAGDRRFVPAGADPRGPGGPPFQTPGLHQEPLHVRRRVSGDHP